MSATGTKRQPEDLIVLVRRLAGEAKVRYELASSRALQLWADKGVDGAQPPDGDFAFRNALIAENAARREYLDLLRICSNLMLGKTDLTEEQTQTLRSAEARNQRPRGNKLQAAAIAARDRLRSVEARHDYAVEREISEVREIGREYAEVLHAYLKAVMDWLGSIDHPDGAPR